MQVTKLESTPVGKIEILWRFVCGHPRVVRILLPRQNEQAAKRSALYIGKPVEQSCPEIDRLCCDIISYLNGNRIIFSLSLPELEICTPFQRLVFTAQHQIPYGSVCSYGELANRIGHPGASRAVGNALGSNPFPLIIPCHRTIKADNSIGGFQGGSELKRALLACEGVVGIRQSAWRRGHRERVSRKGAGAWVVAEPNAPRHHTEYCNQEQR